MNYLSTIFRLGIYVENTQCLCVCVAYIICQHHIKYWNVCAWHTQFEATMQNTEICVCETWNLRLQSSKLASMLRAHNLCVCNIHNLSTLHTVLKSLLVRHQIVPPILENMPWLPTHSFVAACNLLQSYNVLLSIINEICCHPTEVLVSQAGVPVPSSAQEFLLMDKAYRQKIDLSCQTFQS